MQRNRTHNTTGGFSMVELLMVIGVMAILMTILIPNLTHARKMAKSRVAQQYGQNVTLALNNFLSGRPNLSAATLISKFPGGTASVPTTTTMPSGSSPHDCSRGYTLTGGTSNAVVTANTGGAETGALTAWGEPGDPSVKCVVIDNVSTTFNPYDISVYTWSDQLPDKVYINGKLPN